MIGPLKLDIISLCCRSKHNAQHFNVQVLSSLTAYNTVQYHVLGTDKIKVLFHEAAKRNPAGQVTILSSTIEPITNIEIQAVTPGAQKVVIISVHVRSYLLVLPLCSGIAHNALGCILWHLVKHRVFHTFIHRHSNAVLSGSRPCNVCAVGTVGAQFCWWWYFGQKQEAGHGREYHQK
jgi:hypothetical protein